MLDHPSKADRTTAFKYLRGLLALIGLPLLLGLGCWQLQRSEQKQVWLDQQARSPVNDAATALQQLQQQEWVPVSMEVELRPQHTWLLDNRTLNGQVGYEVIVPVRVDDGSFWLANLGWIRAPGRREQLPAFQLRPQRLRVEGMLRRPTGSVTLADQPEETGWPRRIQSVELEQLRAALGIPLEAAMLYLRTEVCEQITPRAAVLQGITPQRHQGYAVQWFSLALALLLWLLWAGRHDRRSRNGQ